MIPETKRCNTSAVADSPTDLVSGLQRLLLWPFNDSNPASWPLISGRFQRRQFAE